MQFQITEAGFTAAFAASNNGPSIRITEFKIGGGFNYVPAASDVALHGEVLHVGQPNAYRVLDAHTAEFTLRMDETIGSWQFGEVGLYMQDGTLFALASLEHQQWKIAYPGTDFNRFNVKVRLVLNGAIPKLDLVVQHITAGIIWELPSVDDLPLIDDAESNVFLCHSKDDTGNEALCTKGSDRWTIGSHMKRVFVGTVSAVGLMEISSVAFTEASDVDGKYLVQFTSGAAKSAVRRVIIISEGRATFLRPEPSVQIGDTFELLESGAAGGGDSGGDSGFFYSLMGR